MNKTSLGVLPACADQLLRSAAIFAPSWHCSKLDISTRCVPYVRRLLLCDIFLCGIPPGNVQQFVFESFLFANISFPMAAVPHSVPHSARSSNG